MPSAKAAGRTEDPLSRGSIPRPEVALAKELPPRISNQLESTPRLCAARGAAGAAAKRAAPGRRERGSARVHLRGGTRSCCIDGRCGDRAVDANANATPKLDDAQADRVGRDLHLPRARRVADRPALRQEREEWVGRHLHRPGVARREHATGNANANANANASLEAMQPQASVRHSARHTAERPGGRRAATAGPPKLAQAKESAARGRRLRRSTKASSAVTRCYIATFVYPRNALRFSVGLSLSRADRPFSLSPSSV